MKFSLTTRIFGLLLGVALVVSSCSTEETPRGILENQQDPEEALSGYSEPIEGQYIIVFKDKEAKANSMATQLSVKSRTKKLFAQEQEQDVEILQIYSSTVSGAAVRLSPSALRKLQGHKDIAYIEQDHIIALAPPCGLRPNDPCPGDPGD